MHMNREFELRLQKCVDEELSGEQQRRFLSDLDLIDNGWKALACGLLEDRLLRKTISRDMTTASVDESAQQSTAADTVRVARVPELPQSRRQPVGWLHQRSVGLLLCSAIAFVSGLLIPEWQSTQKPNVPAVSQGGRGPETIYGSPAPFNSNAGTAIAGGNLATGRRTAPVYQVEYVPEGSSTQRPVHVPVFQGKDDWMDELVEDPLLFSRSNLECKPHEIPWKPAC